MCATENSPTKLKQSRHTQSRCSSHSHGELALHGLNVGLLRGEGGPTIEPGQQGLHAMVGAAVAPAAEPDLREAPPVAQRELERGLERIESGRRVALRGK